MFGLLRAAFTLLICLLGLGFYLGWFHFRKSATDPQSNEMNVNVSVDKKKMSTDLQKFERNVAKRIEDINDQPQGNNQTQPPGRQPQTPGMNFGPISIQPSGQPAQPAYGQPWGQAVPPPNSQPWGQPVQPSNGQPWSVGPYSAQSPSSPPAGPPQIRVQTPDYQFTVPLAVPPPAGEGR